MILRLPARRFLQSTEKTETPEARFGTLQWVLTRAMYRFKIFDLAQVPAKNRMQALGLELAQWTPFSHSDYYVGWHGPKALVWGWDAEKVRTAIAAQGLKLKSAQVLPETVLRAPLSDGLCLITCQEGYEGQFWLEGHIERSRWWPQPPSPDEWLMFQRDAAIAPNQQQRQPPVARSAPLDAKPWITGAGATSDPAIQVGRVIVALCALLLLLPTYWYGFGLYKVRLSTAQIQEQRVQMELETAPIAKARGQALDYLARINTLRGIAPYPGQLSLMAKIAQALPADNSYIKDWDFQQGQLKVTVTSKTDISTTQLISMMQQANSFRNVKALPGQDPKNVMFQMDVIGK